MAPAGGAAENPRRAIRRSRWPRFGRRDEQRSERIGQTARARSGGAEPDDRPHGRRSAGEGFSGRTSYLRNLLIAAGAAAATVAAGYDLWIWAASYGGDNFHNDFTFYYAAARLGLAHGWTGL